MILEFEGEIFIWRGPSPYYFVAVPQEQSDAIKAVSSMVTYGWGVIPVHVQLGRAQWKTSLFPKDGLYLVPLKVRVRTAEDLDAGDVVSIRLEIRP